jgi:hypothetical protein
MPERRTLIIAVTTVIAVGLVVSWTVLTQDRTRPSNLTEITDKTEIGRQVELVNVGILTGENYVGHKIRVITGFIKNNSDKPLRLVDMEMSFLDLDGKPVQQSVERGHGLVQKPIPPGTQHRFEVNFENLPRTWNYRKPDIQVVKIGF